MLNPNAKPGDVIETKKGAISIPIGGGTVTVDAIYANGKPCIDINILKKLGLEIEYDEKTKKFVVLNANEFCNFINSEKKYHKMLQSQAINAISTVRTRNLPEYHVNLIGNAEIKVDDNFMLKISNYNKLKKGVPTSAYMLFDCFIIQFTEQPVKSAKILLPLKKYMEMRGLSDNKSAREQVVRDMAALELIKYEAKEKVKGKWVNSGSVALFGGTGYIKNGIINFNFNADFFNILMNCTVMDYSKETLKINPRLNPYAYHFSRYIDTNYRINEGKERVSIITIPTLISKAPNLPTYDEVMESSTYSRKVFDFIIEPVIRDLDSIDRLYYDFLNEDGVRIEDPLEFFKGTGGYHEFITSKIRVDYSEYEQHSERIEKRKKHVEKIHFVKNIEDNQK